METWETDDEFASAWSLLVRDGGTDEDEGLLFTAYGYATPSLIDRSAFRTDHSSLFAPVSTHTDRTVYFERALAREVDKLEGAYDKQRATEEIKRAARTKVTVSELMAAAIKRKSVRAHIVPSAHLNGKQDLILFVADTHPGKEVTPETLGPSFAYNKLIYADRMQRMVEEVMELVGFLGPRVRDLYIMLGGDNLDGSTMRTGQAWRVDLSVGDQVFVAADTISGMVTQFAPHFRRVIVRSVPGNHGRLRQHLDDDSIHDNHETVMHETVARVLAHEENVQVKVGYREYDLFRAGKPIVLLQHGHRIKGGVDSPVPAAIKYLERQRRAIVGLEPDIYALAHFHQPIQHSWGTNKLLISGCLDGGDDYTCNVLAASAGVSQWLMVSDDEKGVWLTRELLAGVRGRAMLDPEAA